MAKGTTIEDKPGPVTRVTEFYEDVRTEMNKVTWPTKHDLWLNTRVVLLLLAIMAGIVFLYDQVFQRVVLVLLQLGT